MKAIKTFALFMVQALPDNWLEQAASKGATKWLQKFIRFHLEQLQKGQISPEDFANETDIMPTIATMPPNQSPAIGTDNYHAVRGNLLATDGILQLCSQHHLDWLILAIADQIRGRKIDNIQVWTLKVSADYSATIQAVDGDEQPLQTLFIEFTDCPLSTVRLYLTPFRDQALVMLPSEY